MNSEIDLETFRPPDDHVYQYLLSEAAIGSIPVYGLVVHAERLIAFDPSHKPELNVPGKRIVASILERWRSDKAPRPWVYPRGEEFVVADDYFALTAIREAKVNTIACQCLGTPRDGLSISSQGPLPLEWVRRSLGLS